MREELGFNILFKDQKRPLTIKTVAELLLLDLAACRCDIFGKTETEQLVLLAELNIIPDSLSYDMFDQRIDFTVVGDIINNQYVPLTYVVQGQKISLQGRCSTIRRVCGVDLYLNNTYTEKLGDEVRQSFSISVKKAYKRLS